MATVWATHRVAPTMRRLERDWNYKGKATPSPSASGRRPATVSCATGIPAACRCAHTRELHLAGQQHRARAINRRGGFDLRNQRFQTRIDLRRRQQRRRVDRQHGMPDIEIDIVLEDIPPKERARHHARQHIRDQAQAIALVGANGQQRTVHGRGRVGGRLASGRQRPVGRHFPPFALVPAHHALAGHGKRHIQHDGLLAPARDGDAPGVGAQHDFRAAPGRHFGGGIGHRPADQAAFRRAQGMVAGYAKVIAAAHAHHGDAAAFGFVHRPRHGPLRRHIAKALCRVQQGVGGAVHQPAHGRVRRNPAIANAPMIAKELLQPLPLPGMPPLRGGHQAVADDGGFFGVCPQRAHEVAGETSQRLQRIMIDQLRILDFVSHKPSKAIGTNLFCRRSKRKQVQVSSATIRHRITVLWVRASRWLAPSIAPRCLKNGRPIGSPLQRFSRRTRLTRFSRRVALRIT